MTADELRKRLDNLQRVKTEKKHKDWAKIKEPTGDIALRAFEEL